MSAQGAITVRVYAGSEALPILDAGVHIIKRDEDAERLLAYRTTDKNGKTSPVFVETPDSATADEPGNITPFSNVDVRIRHPLYHSVYIHDVQVFADTLTRQQVQMIPNSERLADGQKIEQIYITPQQL